MKAVPFMEKKVESRKSSWKEAQVLIKEILADPVNIFSSLATFSSKPASFPSKLMAMSASPEPRRLSLELLPPPADYHSRSPLPSKTAKNEAAGAEDDDRFRTPTTEESRLNSTPTTCPPPPVKIKRAVGCKRKLSELEFFKVEADEIERLFRPRDLQCVRRRRGNVCHEERETSSSLSSV